MIQMKVLVQSIKKCVLFTWCMNVIMLATMKCRNKSVCALGNFHVLSIGLTIQFSVSTINNLLSFVWIQGKS